MPDNNNQLLSKHADYLLYLLIIFGCIIRFVEVWTHNPIHHLFSDPMRHWEHARATLWVQPMAVIDPPLYQIWLSVVQKWTLGLPVLTATYAGMLSVITPWLWYRFLREALYSRTLALTGWALLAWLPSWIGIFDYFMTETLLLPLLGASLWATLRARRKRTVAAFTQMVVFWLLAGLTRTIAFPLGGLAGFWIWIGYPYKLRCLGRTILILVVALGPLAYRNYYYLHMLSPFGSGWLNQIYAESGKSEIKLHIVRGNVKWHYGFGSPSINRTLLWPFSNWVPSRTGRVNVLIDVDNGEKDWRDAYEQSRVEGVERWKLRWENILLAMVGDSWPDANQDYLSARASMDSRWLWSPLFLIIVGVGIRRWRETWQRPLLPILIVAWFLVQACSLFVVNEGRYRKPFEGLLISQLMVIIDQKRQRATHLLPTSLEITAAV
ncbi:PMT_2 domain-containing protein [Gammaproteobacteria bacterium]